MVESRIRPHGGVVAKFAGGRKPCGRVRRVGRPGVILLMARVTERAVEGIIVVNVAIDALPRRHRVCPGQLESGAGVIERCVRPQHRVVTVFAGRRKSHRCVIHGRGRIVVVRLMARYACRAGQVVVVVDVAIGALPRRRRVRSRQRKSGAAVIEGRVQPRTRVVALIAALRKVRRNVIRIRRPLIILQVAADACCRGQVVVIVHVTIGTQARWHRVHAG